MTTLTASAPGIRGLNRALDRGRLTAERRLTRLEQTYEKLIRAVGRDAAGTLGAHTFVAAANPDWQPPPEGVLVDAEVLRAKAAARLAAEHETILKDTAGTTLGRLGIAWDVTHPLSKQLLAQAAQRTGTALAAAVQPVLRATIAEAYAEGLSVVDAAALIRTRVADAAPAQARMLARTDLNGLANGGSVMVAKMAGVGTKTWLTAGDDRVRPDHAAAEGQSVPIDQPFNVGGEQLAYPGDPDGSDENCANCRCTVIYEEGDPVPETAAVTAATMVEIGWVSDLAFEGTATADGRYILPSALTWRELPLTLMALTETGPGGHEGAFAAGRIDKIVKARTADMDGDPLPEGVTAVRGTGVFDMGGDNGMEVARLVDGSIVRGVSVDLSIESWCLRDPETGDLFEPDSLDDPQIERAMMGELQYAVRKATIMAATVCPTPAFADARIALAASGERIIRLWAPLDLATEAPLTAAAAGLAPARPPRDWFFTPEPDVPTPLTVTKDGRVFGHMALWESCHVGYPGQCVPPPRSPSGYAYFNLGAIECDDDSQVAVGTLTLEGLHADTTPGMTADRARAHYENTAVVGAFVRAVDGRHGIWVAGTLRPDLSERHARDLMGAKPSGDWRSHGPGKPLEMIGVHAVNKPGYAVPRLVASAITLSGRRASMEFGDDTDDATLWRKAMVAACRAEDDPIAALLEHAEA